MRNHILWLASWYPNRLSPYDGDFIQRHAKAVSLINKVTVIFVKKDTDGVVTKSLKKEVNTTADLTEIIVYYSPVKTGITYLDSILSQQKYNSVYREVVEKFIEENGVPALVHVHVALKVARPALWLKKKYSIPFLISEHWSGYLAVAKPNLEDYNPIYYLLYKMLLKRIFNKAECLTVVSKVLGQAITDRFAVKKCYVIPNVVNTAIFFPVQKQSSLPLTKFIHVSSLSHLKNVAGIIAAFWVIKSQGHNFQLIIYGPDNIELKQLVKERDLGGQIFFKEDVPQTILAKDMQQADAIVLYSRYETFGCVVIEANACGVPAILSDLPVFREYIIENKTGIFSKPNDPENLAGTIIQFIQQKGSFSPTEISAYTKSKFSYPVIARQFDELYKDIIEHNADNSP